MKSRRRAIFFVLSLVPCLTIMALWVRSYYVCDIVVLDFKHASKPGWRTEWAMASRTGCIDFGRLHYDSAEASGTIGQLFVMSEYGESEYVDSDSTYHPVRPGLSYHRFPKPNDEAMLDGFWFRNEDYLKKHLGFESKDIVNVPFLNMGGPVVTHYEGWIKTMPHWFALLLATLLPLWRLYSPVARFRARRRVARGHCSNCSYDLRAHKPDDKCPECGAVVPRRT